MNQLDTLRDELEGAIIAEFDKVADSICTSSDSGLTAIKCWCPDCKEAMKEARAMRKEALRFYLGE